MRRRKNAVYVGVTSVLTCAGMQGNAMCVQKIGGYSLENWKIVCQRQNKSPEENREVMREWKKTARWEEEDVLQFPVDTLEV